jgi:hypothetical protein
MAPPPGPARRKIEAGGAREGLAQPHLERFPKPGRPKPRVARAAISRLRWCDAPSPGPDVSARVGGHARCPQRPLRVTALQVIVPSSPTPLVVSALNAMTAESPLSVTVTRPDPKRFFWFGRVSISS